MPKPKAVVMVMPYRAQVALFDGCKAAAEYFDKVLGIDLDFNAASYGIAIRAEDANGITYFGLALEDDANLCTLVHECSHVIDYIFDGHGIPPGPENTEVRAYTLAELVGDVAQAFGFRLRRKKI